MASDFAAYVLSSGAASPAQRRKPSHLMPPTEVSGGSPSAFVEHTERLLHQAVQAAGGQVPNVVRRQPYRCCTCSSAR